MTVLSPCIDELSSLIPPSLPPTPPLQVSASPSALPHVNSCSLSPSPVTPCGIVKPKAKHSPTSPKREDLSAPLPVAVPFTLPRLVDMSAPPWLFPLSDSLEILSLAAPQGSLVPPASPQSVCAANLQAIRGALALYPFGSSRIHPPSGSTWVLCHAPAPPQSLDAPVTP